MKKVKTISVSTVRHLDKFINRYIEDNRIEECEIQYRTGINNSNIEYTAMIIYNKEEIEW